MKRLLFVFSALLSAQSSLDAPPIASVLDSGGAVTPIHGLAGNFIPGRPAPGAPLLAYSNDGLIEWRLARGLLSATRNGQTAVFPTAATRALFRGNTARFPEFNLTIRLDEDSLVESSDEPPPQLAGRVISWQDGKLRILQPGGAVEEIDCLQEPEHMTAAAASWAHLTIGGRAHLLRLTPGRVQLFVLPQRSRE